MSGEPRVLGYYALMHLAGVADRRGWRRIADCVRRLVPIARVERGISRDEAYRIVQRNAMDAWESQRSLHDLLAADPEVKLDPDTLAECFSPQRFLRNTGVVFDRLEAEELQAYLVPRTSYLVPEPGDPPPL